MLNRAIQRRAKRCPTAVCVLLAALIVARSAAAAAPVWGARPAPAPGLGPVVVLAMNEAPAPVSAPAPGKALAVENPHGNIKAACEECHTAESWTKMRRPTRFQHASTGFPLDGRHASAECRACHGSLGFSRVATSCVDCHRDVHEGRKGLRCQECHTASRWVDRSDAVRRHASTGFPLRGAHALVECARCHGGSDEGHLTRASTACASCHASDYAAARNPDHKALGYSTQCQDCHDAARTTWTGSGFNHAATGFALTGAHGLVGCASCHPNNRFAGTPTDCYACHRTNFEATTNPNHVAGGFATACVTCHSTNAWRPAAFNHAATGFALTGGHASVACASCHPNGRFTGTPTDCYACHRTNYEAALNPPHAASGFGTTCTTCHTTTAWQPSTWDHDAQFFRIYSGTHRGRWTSCATCHTSPSNFAVFTCLQCHSQSATDPHHSNVSGYRYDSNACYSCHRRS